MPYRARSPVCVAAVAVAVALGGCGLGAGRGTTDVSVEVTSEFGARPIGHAADMSVSGSETVMALTQRLFRVKTTYGGGFLETIDGHSGTGDHVDWFYYVNGIEAPAGAAATAVHRGDRIWWDLHDWSATASIPAVVGAYPQPFTGAGLGVGRPAVRLRCARPAQRSCGIVAAALGQLGVSAVRQGLGHRSSGGSLMITVGTWKQIGRAAPANLIAGGPRSGGVYAQFADRGQALALDNPRGVVTRRLRRDAGLVAATRAGSGAAAWFVTGTDAAGVLAAARAFNAVDLRDHFALAVSGRRLIPVPVAAGA